MLRNGVKESQIIANLCGEFLEDARQRVVQMMDIRENAKRSEKGFWISKIRNSNWQSDSLKQSLLAHS